MNAVFSAVAKTWIAMFYPGVRYEMLPQAGIKAPKWKGPDMCVDFPNSLLYGIKLPLPRCPWLSNISVGEIVS